MITDKQLFIEDHTSPLDMLVDGTFIINKNYEKECKYWAKVWDEEHKEGKR